MYTPSASAERDSPDRKQRQTTTTTTTAAAAAAADLNSSNNGQYYAGSLGQETDVMHQYYTDHSHHQHHLAAIEPTHHYHPHRHHLAASHHPHLQPASSGAATHLGHHHLHPHPHHHHHHHQYPTGCATTESSLSSSAFMTQSALRLSALFRGCCSKRCLLIFCLSLILLIFIFVISLSAYLNFLINANKTNLSPLSGRLRVGPQQQQQQDSNLSQLNNRTSMEFLAKQREYEIILRGALDRTQTMLKTYPNHLVKLEVYAFKPATSGPAAAASTTNQVAISTGLWVYYRLFLNKKSLLQDGQLMKRKSPDEHMERQFLPRLTQQSLQSGFEQLLATFNARSSRSVGGGGGGGRQQQQQQQHLQQQALRSFDDQISRLMPIIESIDLQSIQVSPEFDMLAMELSPASEPPQSMSDNLRASQPLTPPTTVATPPANSIMFATGKPMDGTPDSDTEKVRTDSQAQSEASSATNQQQQQQDQVNASKKFTLYGGYKQNSTRPIAAVITNGARRDSSQQQAADSTNTGSLFLVNHQQRKPTTTTTTTAASTPTSGVRIVANGQQQQQMATTNQPPALIQNHSNSQNSASNGNFGAASDNSSKVVKLVSGQPVRAAGTNESSVGNLLDDKSSSGRSLFDPLPSLAKTSTSTASSQVNRQSSSASSLGQSAHDSARQKPTQGSTRSTRPAAAATAGNGNNAAASPSNETPLMQMVAPHQKIEFSSTSAPTHERLSNSNGQSSTGTTSLRQHDSPAAVASVVDLWNEALKERNSNSPSSRYRQQQDDGQGLISVTTIGAGKKRQNHTLDWQKVSILSADISDTIRAELVNSAATEQPAAAASSATQKPKVAPHLNQGGSLIVVASNKPTTTTTQATPKEQSAIVLNREFKQVNAAAAQDKGQQLVAASGQNKNERQWSAAAAQVTTQPTNSRKPSSTTKPRQQKQPGISNKKKKVSGSSSSNQTNGTSDAPVAVAATGANLPTTRGIRIVDNFLATLEAANGNGNKTAALANQREPQAQGDGSRDKSQEAFNYNADNLAPTLPTTIELTRSTTPSASRTSLLTANSGSGSGRQQEAATSPHQHNNRNDVDFTTTASSSATTATGSATEPAQGSILPAASGTTESSFRAQQQQQRQQTNRDRLAQFAAAAAAPVRQQVTSPSSSSSSLGGQWRPMAGTTAANFTGSQLANFSQLLRRPTTTTTTTASTTHLIVPAISSQIQRPTGQFASVNQQPSGSQSPFAMSILEATDNDQTNNRLTNVVHYQAPPTTASGANNNNNESALFESHRTSRMRLMAAVAVAGEQLLNSSSSVDFDSSSLANGDRHRIVDDFMITPDKIVEGNTRGTTLIPPLVLSSFSTSTNHLQALPGARISKVDLIGATRPRTKGPFAFETLKESSSSSMESPVALKESDSAARLVERSLANANTNGNRLDEKILVRKRLFLGGGGGSSSGDETAAGDLSTARPTAAADPLNSSPATTNPIESLTSSSSPLDLLPSGASGSVGESDTSSADRPEAFHHHHHGRPTSSGNNNYRLDRFGVRTRQASSSSSSSSSSQASGQIPASAVRIIMRKQHGDNSAGQPTWDSQQTGSANLTAASESRTPFRCQYYGCKSKVGAKFTCLNGTQICDDFIDCQDESDELDCVSLLKYDDNAATDSSQPLNKRRRPRLSFSNGAGIIYLNRKGSLAPLCIDHLHPSASANDKLTTFERNNNQRQQELIKQVNTIGQYVCSLQSFSRLVSVKINHHNLVDGLDIIKNSKLYHRLSIVGPTRAEGFDAASSSSSSSQYGRDLATATAASSGSASFRSGSSEHEVEISTSPDCPSQRTVFVKCGGFECGQDSFSIIQDQNDNGPGKKRTGVITNNFPWLVKIYWMGSLACHGYLIDELWLISSSQCFVNKTQTKKTTSDGDGDEEQPTTTAATGGLSDNDSGWTAEISYEHYGKAANKDDDVDDHGSIPFGPSNQRRSISEILMQATSERQEPHLGSPIVLAKLEEPVRFGPLNRPICLPLSSSLTVNKTTTMLDSETLPDKHYKDCFTIGLPPVTAATAGNRSLELNNAPTQSPTLNKVKVHEIMNCFTDSANLERTTPLDVRGTTTTSNDHEQAASGLRDKPKLAGRDISNLICVSDREEKKLSSSPTTSASQNDNARPPATSSGTKKLAKDDDDDSTRVLICSTIQAASRSRSRWTVVGVQYKVPELQKQLLSSDRHLFSKVSSQIDWIVDTMNPKFSHLYIEDTNNNNSGDVGLNLKSDSRGVDQSQTCNKFKCSSGECLSWSRICDGLYDCSSQDDEKDCHK